MVSGPVRVQRVIKFGEDFELDLRAFELRRAGRPLKLERIPLQILLLLLDHNQELVTRDEIIERIWGKDVFLDTDNSINGAIRKIRQALRDDPEQPRFVQTVTGLGYRFIADVVENGHEPLASPTSLPESSNGQALAQPRTDTFRLSPRIALIAIAALFVIAVLIFAAVLMPSHPSPFQAVKTVRLTSSGQSGKAAISPDGSYIAHTVISSGQESLRLRRANMLSDVELVPAQQVHYLGLTFSPDSQTVYYVAQKTGDEPGTLYRVSVIGGTSQKVNERLDSSISFSPDGKRYAFVRESATASTLLIADLDGGLERIVISRKLPEVLDYPAWSPDGRAITVTDTDASVVSPRGSNARLVEVRIDGTERDLSLQRWGFIREIAWLHNQRGLVMSARSPEESGFFHLWYVSYPEGAARQITEGVYRQRGVSISADSREMITVQENAFSSIWRVQSLRDATPELVVSGESGTSAPVWTAGDKIIFEEELNGRRSIFSVSPDGSNRKELTLAGNNYDASVSGSGGLLAFVSDRSGTPAIWTMDLDSGRSQLLTKATGQPVPQLSTDTIGAAVPQLSPDGTWIAFTAIGSSHWTTLWRIPSTGGEAKQLNEKFWFRPVISRDGNWIAGFYDDGGQLNTQTKPTSIAVISSGGGTPRKVFHIPFSVVVSGGLRWSHDGQAVCYINNGKEGSNIWEQPVNGGAPRQITRFEGVDLFSFDWSPDGKQLTFSRGLQARDVVLVEDIRRK